MSPPVKRGRSEDMDDVQPKSDAKKNSAEHLLHDACSNGLVSEVTRLVSDGADVNAKVHGLTAIQCAAIEKQRAVVSRLISFAETNKPADLKPKFKDSSSDLTESLLVKAARFGWAGIVERLLELEEDGEESGKNGMAGYESEADIYRAMEVACENGYVEVVKVLDKNYWHKENNGYEDYLKIAVDNNRAPVVEFFLRKQISDYKRQCLGWE